MQNGVIPMISLGDSSILEWAKEQPSLRLYAAYVQFASDSPSGGTDVSFVILDKAAQNYMYFYGFVYSNIYYANANSSTSKLNWSVII